MYDSRLESVVQRCKAMLTGDKARRKFTQNWMMSFLLQGTEKTEGELSTALNNFALCSGLLLSATFPLTLAPPGGLATAQPGDMYLTAYTILMVLSVIFHLSTITCSVVTVFVLNTSIRTSDKLLIMIYADPMPTVVLIFFTLGSLALVLAASVAIRVTVGITAVISSLTLFLVSIALPVTLAAFLVPVGHAAFGWYKSERDACAEVLLGRLDDLLLKNEEVRARSIIAGAKTKAALQEQGASDKKEALRRLVNRLMSEEGDSMSEEVHAAIRGRVDTECLRMSGTGVNSLSAKVATKNERVSRVHATIPAYAGNGARE